MDLNFTIKMTDILTILAIILGPIISVQLSEFLQRRRKIEERKREIFKNIMSTRTSRISPQHVQALNLIDIEFYGIKDVQESWKIYLDHLNDIQAYNNSVELWSSRGEELLFNLLYAMSVHLGYSFDKVMLKRGIYSPQGHGTNESELTLIRKGLVGLFTNKASLPIKVDLSENDNN